MFASLGQPPKKISWAKKLLLPTSAPIQTRKYHKTRSLELSKFRKLAFDGNRASVLQNKCWYDDSLKLPTAVAGKEALRDLISKNEATTPAVYNELLTFYFGTFLKPFFEETIEAMERAKVTPDTETFNLYLGTLATWPDYALSTTDVLKTTNNVVNHMKAINVPHDITTEKMLFSINAKYNFDETYRLLLMEAGDTSPLMNNKVKILLSHSPSVLQATVIITYFKLDFRCNKITSSFIKICRKFKDVSSARKQFNKLKTPTYSNYRSMWLVYVDAGDYEEVIKLTEECNKAYPEEPTSLYYYYIIEALATNYNSESEKLKRREIALRWYGKALSESSVTSVNTFSFLVSLCDDDVEIIEKLREDMRSLSINESRRFKLNVSKVYEAAGVPMPAAKPKGRPVSGGRRFRSLA